MKLLFLCCPPSPGHLQRDQRKVQEVASSYGFITCQPATCIRGMRLCYTLLSLCLFSLPFRELRLRNYVPEDEDLKKRRVPQAKPIAGRWAASPPLFHGTVGCLHLGRCHRLLENN